MMVPFLGREGTLKSAADVLDVIVSKGNAKEVFLKCVEALRGIRYIRNVNDDSDEDTLKENAAPNLNERINPVIQTVQLCNASMNGTFHSSDLTSSIQTYSDETFFTVSDYICCGAIDKYHQRLPKPCAV
jgi:hypothetical protein